MTLLLGNIVALIASILMVYTGIIKKKNTILYIQTVQILLSTLSNIILGGITGTIINLLSCIRNILCYYDKLMLKEKAIIIILSLILSLTFNNMGVIGLLPVFSIVTYTIFMNVKNIIKFKLLIIFSMSMWFIYDLCIKSYVAAAFDFMCVVANIISIIGIKVQNKR